MSAITIDELQTLVCHSSVLPGTYGVAAIPWYSYKYKYTIGCGTLDSYRVRTPAVNTWRESRHWRDVTNPYSGPTSLESRSGRASPRPKHSTKRTVILLNDEYNHPIPSDKLKKVYPKITNDAQPKRAQVSKGTNHPSWADVAKSKPPDGSNGRLLSILKKGSPILPL